MTAFFDSLAGFFSNIGGFFSNMLESIKMLFVTIPAAFDWLRYIMAFLPAPIVGFALLSVTLSILFLVLGRHS